MTITVAEKAASEACPSCGTRGRSVEPVTIESLVTEEARARVAGTGGFRFCATPSCDVAYFRSTDGARILRSEVRVRIGQKENGPPRPVCYCFEHTVEEIEAEVSATGTSTVVEDITAKCRQGLDRCEETNPQGACCLGNVRGAIKEAQRRHAGQSGTPPAADGKDEQANCCTGGALAVEAPPSSRSNAGLWATGGAAVSAVLSSACCWLPLLLIAFGASAAGVAGFFEAYRPALLGATGLLLAGGFYLVYFRRENCGSGEACAAPNPRLRRINKAMLWVATSVVLVFALFPNYVGYLLKGGGSPAVAATAGTGGGRVFEIDGMTCEACAVTLREHLRGVPGVAGAEVSFEEKTARVTFAAGDAVPSDDALLAVIKEAGYSGTPAAEDRTIQVAIRGMTCAGCAGGLEASLTGLQGVRTAQVDYDSASATVVLGPEASVETVLGSIAAQGFEGEVKAPAASSAPGR